MSVGEVHWLSLLPALLAFLVYLTLLARASFHILRAAYPESEIRFRRIWGAYFAGYGFNSVVPARSGDVIRLFLTKISVPVLVMHGDDDQVVPYADSGPLSAKLVQNGTLKTYSGFPHGMPTTQSETINADLLAWLQAS